MKRNKVKIVSKKIDKLSSIFYALGYGTTIAYKNNDPAFIITLCVANGEPFDAHTLQAYCELWRLGEPNGVSQFSPHTKSGSTIYRAVFDID